MISSEIEAIFEDVIREILEMVTQQVSDFNKTDAVKADPKTRLDVGQVTNIQEIR